MNSKLKSRRKRTLKQWVSFAFRGVRKRTYKTNVYLHRYEEEIILRDVREMGGTFTYADLCNAHPGRYDPNTLAMALKRMKGAGVLSGKRSSWGTRMTAYSLTKSHRDEAAAA